MQVWPIHELWHTLFSVIKSQSVMCKSRSASKVVDCPAERRSNPVRRCRLRVTVNACTDVGEMALPVTLITVRRYALHGLSYRNSVRPSVTLVHCVHMVRPTIMISSPYGSPIILVSGDITLIPKFKGVTPSDGVE